MTIALMGVGVFGSRPVAIGNAWVMPREAAVAAGDIPSSEIDHELKRLDGALDCARAHLESVRAQIPVATPVHIAEFIDAHLLMLTDSSLVDATRDLIRQCAVNAAWALQMQRDVLVDIFDQMEDPYLRTRRDDVDHVVRQIQGYLTDEPAPDGLTSNQVAGRVVVATDITPADAILLRQHGVAAFVTEHGGPMSHTAILARSLDIPTVVGVHNATQLLQHGESLVVNAETGTVLAGANDQILAHYQARLARYEQRRTALRALLSEPSTSRDGVPVVLLANLELPEDVEIARANGASGVGLYRTEFLYMNRSDFPDEEEHFATYAGIIKGLDGIPLTIRTVDLGVDKQTGALDHVAPTQTNPALGLRGIRLCLTEPSLFIPQLRAALRASALGPVRLMIPMISTIAEIDTVLALLTELRRKLRNQGLAFDPLMAVGAMIEVPAAALCADAIARRVDFLSIGTNDLTQYTLAIDRTDDTVSYLYEPLHPAVLRLLQMTLAAGKRTSTPVGMCGEMAGDPRYTRVLLGLGLREFSMQPGSLLEVKDIVRQCHIGALQRRMDLLMDDIDDLTPTALLRALAQETAA